jgi:Holliday junction resolvasome RuvABC endonuclease subunit
VIRAIGIDMAFANVGLARVLINPEGPLVSIECLDLHLLQTERGDRKVVRASSDDLRRAQELHAGLRAFVQDAQFAFAEVPSGAKDANAARLLGMATGVLAGLQIPVIEVSPMEVKEAVTGKRSQKGVPKPVIIEWAAKRWPDAPWLRHARAGKGYKPGDLMNDNEHLADAMAAVQAGVRTPEFQRLMVLHATSSSSRQRPPSRRIPID